MGRSTDPLPQVRGESRILEFRKARWDTVLSIGGEEKEAGWLTSSARSKRFDKEIALGFMKRPFLPNKFKLDARDPANAFQSAARIALVRE